MKIRIEIRIKIKIQSESESSFIYMKKKIENWECIVFYMRLWK